MKIDRVAVHNKFGGRCAYCGEEISLHKMQVDHWWPKTLEHMKEIDIHNFDNLMPSCQKCNNFKSGMMPEVFREELQMQVTRLLKNAQFNRALKFGQVLITEHTIKFYYETYCQQI